MSTPTEREILTCLFDNLRLAAEHCDALGRLPAKGPTYAKLLENISLIEGAARSAAWYRDDAGTTGTLLGVQGTHGFEATILGKTDSQGWLEVAHQMGELQRRVGGWIRGHYRGHELFFKAAAVLREMHRQLQRRAEMPLGRSTLTQGPALPPQHPGPLRDTRPVQVPRATQGACYCRRA